MKKIIGIGLFLFLCAVKFGYAQEHPREHGMGAILLSKEEYDALPHLPLERGTANRGGACPNVVMLNAPPVMNQGDQGSCIGFGVSYAAMSILMYPQFNYWNATSERSPSYMYNQIKIGTGCDGGSEVIFGLDLAVNQGVSSLALMPYDPYSCSAMPNTAQSNDASAHKARGYYALYANNSGQIRDVICDGYPVVIAFYIRSAFDHMWANGGVWDVDSGAYRGRHCACIIGYDDSRQAFKVQNSWGTGGGDNGYFWMTYNNVDQGCILEAYMLYLSNCQSSVTISGHHNAPLTESSNWIKTSGYTIANTSQPVRLDADPVNGYVELNDDFLAMPLDNNSVFVAQALDGCSNAVPFKAVVPADGLNLLNQQSSDIIVYPNPATATVSFKINEAKGNPYVIEIVDVNARIVKKMTCTDAANTIDISSISNGVYFVRAYVDGREYHCKFLKTN